jgi:hypothetical protein
MGGKQAWRGGVAPVFRPPKCPGAAATISSPNAARCHEMCTPATDRTSLLYRTRAQGPPGSPDSAPRVADGMAHVEDTRRVGAGGQPLETVQTKSAPLAYVAHGTTTCVRAACIGDMRHGQKSQPCDVGRETWDDDLGRRLGPGVKRLRNMRSNCMMYTVNRYTHLHPQRSSSGGGVAGAVIIQRRSK